MDLTREPPWKWRPAGWPRTKARLSWWVACLRDGAWEAWCKVWRPRDRCMCCGELRPDDAKTQGWKLGWWGTGAGGLYGWQCPHLQRSGCDGQQW